jgi:hypothetical protein
MVYTWFNLQSHHRDADNTQKKETLEQEKAEVTVEEIEISCRVRPLCFHCSLLSEKKYFSVVSVSP